MKKKRIRSIPVKVICFILCVLCFTVTAASVLGAIVMANEDFYARSEEDIFRDSVEIYLSSDVYDILWMANAQGSYYISQQTFDEEYSSEMTNLRYALYFYDEKTNEHRVFTNISGDIPQEKEAWKHNYWYWSESNRLIDTFYEGTSFNGTEFENYPENTDILRVYFEEGLPINDVYSNIRTGTRIAYALRYWIYAIAAVSLLAGIMLFVLLMCISGKTPESEEIKKGFFGKIPFDIILAAYIFVSTGNVTFINNGLMFYFTTTGVIILGSLCAIGEIIITLALAMSVSARIKRKDLFTNTVIWKACLLAVKFTKWCLKKLKSLGKKIAEIIRLIPIFWKAVAVIVISAIVNIIIFATAVDVRIYDIYIIAILLETLALIVGAVYIGMWLKALQKGGKALADGDLEYKINTEKMHFDFKDHGENLNSIGDGMAKAVEARLKSERTKAELITNVSHDIKTPLTSIINYASLISEEDCLSEKHKEYSEVLVRKSVHLKRLLEDIVEISKATTGNLDVDLQPCEAQVLLAQASGEFQQKCDDAGLNLVTKTADEPLRILADSRRIWRVFENLMNNACKYSLEGSRVYLSLAREGNDALFIFRNTSKEALNISPDELTERFVRGDEARSTEGNGLGLSIARSLVELQKGKMEIVIDGDLFKVMLRFPII